MTIEARGQFAPLFTQLINYLTEHGIDGARLVAQGFGPDEPIDSNKTAAGKARNRRIEFKLID